MSKPSFSVERVCTMSMINFSIVSMSAMLMSAMTIMHRIEGQWTMVAIFGALAVFCAVYCAYMLFKCRAMLGKHFDSRIKEEVEKAVTSAFTNTNQSDRIEAKVNQAVTDRIEKSDIVRLEEVNTPAIIHPDNSAVSS